MNIKFKYISTNQIKLHVAMVGPEDGTPVILLHGFPDAWFGWEAQMMALAEAGFRVIAPDQRGYNLSDKPKGVASYHIDALVGDVMGLADALGYDEFDLGGHDWGANVSWQIAMRYPERIKRLMIANVPHPSVMGKYMLAEPAQMLKSWYMFFFQLPFLPEALVKAKNWKFFSSVMPDDLTEEKLERYRRAWAQPGATTTMIHWYRSIFKGLKNTKTTTKIQVPTLIVWGQQDPHLSYEMAGLSLDYCEDGRLVTFEDATHWVLHDKADEVSREMIDQFQEN